MVDVNNAHNNTTAEANDEFGHVALVCHLFVYARVMTQCYVCYGMPSRCNRSERVSVAWVDSAII